MFGRKKKNQEPEKASEVFKEAEPKKEFTEVDPRALVSVPVILCPMCGLPMEIKNREEVEVTSRGLRGKNTKKVPHLIYQCATDKTEFKLNLMRRGGGGGCFIATAAYGTSTAHEINVLRSFRDNVLMKESAGRSFISFYYTVSPTIAKMISKSGALRLATRVLLVPIIKAVKRSIEI
jgi:hypothetical protein